MSSKRTTRSENSTIKPGLQIHEAPRDEESKNIRHVKKSEEPVVEERKKTPTANWRSTPNVVTRFRLLPNGKHASKTAWEPTALIVCLRFSKKGYAQQSTVDNKVEHLKAEVQSPLNVRDATLLQTSSKIQNAMVSTSDNPNKKRTPRKAFKTSNITQSTKSSTFPSTPPKARAIIPSPAATAAQWTDNISAFNMKAITSTLLPSSKTIPLPAASQHWFPSAVPIFALLPPGTPLTASEINAYYPHHIRWIGIMSRLANNGYRGGRDILPIQSFFRGVTVPPRTINDANQLMRNILKRKIPSFKTADGAWEGVPDANLSTEGFHPGSILLSKVSGGFIAPTFDDLVKGLRVLPEGDSARELTMCLLWWLQNRDMFTPRLEFNVLQVPWLVRALRVPLPLYGSRNLDQEALQEWREKGSLPSRNIKDAIQEREYHQARRITPPPKELPHSRLEINPKTGSVKLHKKFEIRHILTFPFMSIYNMNTAALVELDRRKSKQATNSTSSVSPPSTTATDRCSPLNIVTSESSRQIPSSPQQNPSTPSLEEAFHGYRIPKKRHAPPDSPREERLSLRKKIARDTMQRRQHCQPAESPLRRLGGCEGSSSKLKDRSEEAGEKDVEPCEEESPLRGFSERF